MAKRVNANVKWHEFVPWAVTGAFLVLIIGIAVWASQSKKMVQLSAAALKDLGLNVEARMHTVGSAWVGWMTTLYLLMGLSSMTIAVWRRALKLTSDARGGRQHITRRWLLCHSITIGLWFFILLLLVLIIVGQALWLATAYAIDKAALVGAKTVERHINITRAANISRATLLDPPGTCNITCVDLSEFELVLGRGLNNTCICSLDKISAADSMVVDALTAVGGSTVGAVFLFVAATWFLMVAAGDQSATRRELAIMKEIEAQDAEGSGLLGKRTAFWKRSGSKRKKGPGEGGDDSAPGGRELSTIRDTEQGGDPAHQSAASGDEKGGGGGSKAAKGGGGKGGKASRASAGEESDDSESLMGGKAHSNTLAGPKRSSASFLDMSRNIGRGMNDAVSKGLSGAVSGAKKSSSKLFGAAIRGAMGMS